MNRPRNRQPRPIRGNDAGGGGGGRCRRGGGGGGGRGTLAPATAQQEAAGRGRGRGRVPTTGQVVPGAAVLIVLKQDQGSGVETGGVVGEVLTAGNHARGIKVRLRDGRVGRVQRMDGEAGEEKRREGGGHGSGSGRGRGRGSGSDGYADVRRDGYLDPPSSERSLAEFWPVDFEETEAEASSSVMTRKSVAQTQTQTQTLDCPLCGDFEGDEVAVTHHIERVHLE